MESIEISFHYDNHCDQSLFKLWKLTRHDYVSSNFSSTQRLNNRSWRLLSKRFLLNQSIKGLSSDHVSSIMNQGNYTLSSKPRQHHASASSSGCSSNNSSMHGSSSRAGTNSSLTDLSRDSLSDFKPKASQFLSDRPSLFSHSSNLSLLSHRKSTLNSSVEFSYKPSKKGGIPDSEDDSDDDDDDAYDSDNDFDDSEDDISDISEVDEDYSDQEQQEESNQQEQNNQQEQEKSRSQSQGDKSQNQDNNDQNHENDQNHKQDQNHDQNRDDKDHNNDKNRGSFPLVDDKEQEDETSEDTPQSTYKQRQRANSNFSQINTATPPLTRTRTSFVRGFSPSNTSAYISSSHETAHALNNPPLDSQANHAKIFYFGNSPSPPEKQDSEQPPATPKNLPTENHLAASRAYSGNTDSSPKSIHDFSPDRSPSQAHSQQRSRAFSQISQKDLDSSLGPTPYIHRQDSLFSNFQLNFKKEEEIKVEENTNSKLTKSLTNNELTVTVSNEVEDTRSEDGYTSTEISEDDYSDDDDEDDELETRHQHQSHIKEEGGLELESETAHTSTILESPLERRMSSNTTRTRASTINAAGNDNDGEWVSVSSSSDDAQDKKFNPLQFNKRHIPKSSIPSTDVSSGSSNIRSNSTSHNDGKKHYIPTNDQKRYSSPAIFKPKSLLSGLFEHSNQLGNSAADFTSKPILKRSSTTGVITFNQVRSYSTGNHLYHPQQHQQQFQSLQSQNSQSKAKRPYIMLAKKYNSSTDISKNYPHYHNNHVKKDILRDFSDNASVKAGTGTSSFHIEDEEDYSEVDDSLLGKQKSMVGISDFNVTANPSSVPTGHNEICEAAPAPYEVSNPRILSRNSDSNNNIYESLSTSLSKLSGSVPNNSRRNLLSRSSLSLTKLYNNSKTIFGKSDTNISRHHELRGKGKTPELPNETESSSLRKPREEQQNGEVRSLTFKTASREESPSATLPVIAGKSSLTGDVDIKTIKQTSNPLAFENRNLSKLSPKSTRRSMLSTELSESLRQSIIIDYKLGKIPLPTKVISNDKLIRAAGKEGVVIGGDFDEHDFDDYHSKGW